MRAKKETNLCTCKVFCQCSSHFTSWPERQIFILMKGFSWRTVVKPMQESIEKLLENCLWIKWKKVLAKFSTKILQCGQRMPHLYLDEKTLCTSVFHIPRNFEFYQDKVPCLQPSSILFICLLKSVWELQLDFTN